MTGSWVVSCVTKLVARLGSVPDTSQSQVAILLASTDTDIQQVRRGDSEGGREEGERERGMVGGGV